MQGLSDAVQRLPETIFATVDGAWFDNLPGSLTKAGFSHRSLLRTQHETELQCSGPWLVEINTSNRREAISRILSLIGTAPAVVLWSCPAGQEALYRHLRSLNEVVLPDRSGGVAGNSHADRAEGSAGLAEAVLTCERALFRHWDPRVLASVALLVDEAQAARLLGPAEGFAMDAGYGRGVVTVTPPPGLPSAPPGPLRFTIAQVDALTNESRERHRGETMTYLRAHCREETIDLDNRILYGITLDAERNAHDLGLVAGDDLIMFAWLWVATRSNHTGGGELRSVLMDRLYGSTPSSRLATLWTALDEAGTRERPCR